MSTPDVRVRLSPEGIKEVIAALRAVQNEAGQAGRKGAGGVNVLNSALRDLKSLLPAIGLAAVVGGFIALTRAALQTADAMGKAQEKFGGTVEDISALNLAFRQNQSDQEGLQTALSKTAALQADVAAGNEKALDTIRRFGLEAKAFAQLNTPRALEEIARKIATIPPGAQRAAAAADVFGDKIGPKLLTALNAVGTQGIDPFIKKARELGVLIDEDLARAAARANDALDTIKIQAEGLATQFAAGLAPAVASAMEEFTRAVTGDGVNGMRAFGEAVGFIIKSAVLLFVGLGKTIGAQTAKIISFVNAIIEASKAIARGDFEAAGEAFRASARERAQITADLAQDVQDTARRLFVTQPGAGGAGAGAGSGVLPSVDENARRTQQARAAFVRQSLQNELKLQQEGIKSAEEALKRGYERGVLSLEQYFDKRRQLIEQNIAAEVAALRLEKQATLDAASGDGEPKTEAERIKLKQDLAKLDQQIRVAQIQGARELAALEQERFDAAKDLRNEQIDLEARLAELEGSRHAAFQLNLQQEIQQVIELGKRAGQTAEQIAATVERLTTARTNAFNFEEISRRGQAALDAFNRDADQIRRDQEAGVISQIEGELRLIDLERERLTVLQELAQAALAAAEATGSEEQIARAQQYAASIDEIARSYQTATQAGAQLRSGTINALQQGFQTLLSNADKIRSVGDAFKDLARTVVATLQQIVAEILARQAILALVRAFGAASGAGSAATQAGSGLSGATAGFARYGGRIRGYTAGGDVRGTQLPIPGPDKVPILAQHGEFMMRKARVDEPGALNFLRGWNSGRFRLADVLRFPRYATGGEIGAPQGTPPAATAEGGSGLRIINLLDPDLVSDGINSASGERAVVNVISRNAVSVRRLLGVR